MAAPKALSALGRRFSNDQSLPSAMGLSQLDDQLLIDMRLADVDRAHDQLSATAAALGV